MSGRPHSRTNAPSPAGKGDAEGPPTPGGGVADRLDPPDVPLRQRLPFHFRPLTGVHFLKNFLEKFMRKPEPVVAGAEPAGARGRLRRPNGAASAFPSLLQRV